MIKLIEKHPVKTLFSLIFLMLLTHLDVLSISIMEARNFITAREMLHDGNWLLPTMNGLPRYQKPPLPTWITAIFGAVFGIKNIIALRLPAMLMVFFLSFGVYSFSNKLLHNKLHAFINALITISSFYIIAIPIEAPWDIYAHTFMLFGLYFLFLFFKGSNKHWKNVILSSFFIGLSILSKGPVSLYVLFLPFIISYGIVYRFKEFKTKIIPFITLIIVFICIGFGWFYYVRITDSAAFLAIAKKETGNWSSYNVRPFYYYWSFFTQIGIWTIPAFISLLYPYLKNKVENKKAYTFVWLWTIITVILLSIIPEKKSRYLMPVLIPLAINTGFYIHYLINYFKKLKLKKDTFPVYFSFGLIGIIAIILPLIIYLKLKDNLQDAWLSFGMVSIVSIAIGITLIKYLKRKNIKIVFYLTVLFMVSIFLFGMPLYKIIPMNKKYNSITNFNKNSDLNLYYYNSIAPEMIWNYGSKIKKLSINEINKTNNKSDSFYLLISKKNIKKLSVELPNYKFKQLNIYNENTTKNKDRLIRHLLLISR